MITCIEAVLSLQEIRDIKRQLICGEFVSGDATAGYRARRVKHNEQLKRDDDTGAEIRKTIVEALKRNNEFNRSALPKRIRSPLISKYTSGMEYGFHVDDALMGKSASRVRSDVSVTIFLSDPCDYAGGELLMHSPFGPQEIKLPAGCAVCYPSSTLHKVQKVQEGTRLAAVTWVESFVRDAAKRELLYDLNQVRHYLGKEHPEAEETDLAFKTYSNLLRMWSET